MGEIIWDESFSVDNPKMDNQHQRIISMINKLGRVDDLEVSSETVADTLTNMIEYSKEHFRIEEQMLVQSNYPDYARHRELHKDFLKKTVSFCTATTLKVDEVPSKLLLYLSDWWKDHILVQDMKYRFFFEKMKRE